MIEAAGWQRVRLERLHDVEWTQVLATPLSLRLLGVTPEFAVVADALAVAPSAPPNAPKPAMANKQDERG